MTNTTGYFRPVLDVDEASKVKKVVPLRFCSPLPRDSLYDMVVCEILNNPFITKLRASRLDRVCMCVSMVNTLGMYVVISQYVYHQQLHTL